MNSSIVVSSDKLKKNILKKKMLNEIINGNLYRLNTIIDTAYKNNKDQIVTNLPIIFNIPDTLNHKEFSLEVYYNIIEILEKKNYKVNIRIKENETLIKINWRSDNNDSIDQMKKKLKDIHF